MWCMRVLGICELLEIMVVYDDRLCVVKLGCFIVVISIVGMFEVKVVCLFLIRCRKSLGLNLGMRIRVVEWLSFLSMLSI